MVENEFPGNSRRERSAPADKEEKKIEAPVVMGEVVRRKKPLGRRFMETFIGGDAKGVVNYIVMDVLIPAAKDTIADVFTQAIERTLFGESRSTSRRSFRSGGSGGYVSYNRFSSSSNASREHGGFRREEPRPISNRSRITQEFDDIILSSRVEAETVIDRLFDLVQKYDQATISDLYELVGVTPTYTDEKWGWTDIRGASVRRIGGGYLLDLPRPEALK